MFTKPDEGAIWRNDWNRYVWHPALEAAGAVPGRENGFHQLLSTGFADGVDVRALAEYLGHTDPGFTLRVYCHLMPSRAARARGAVDRALSKGENFPSISQAGVSRP